MTNPLNTHRVRGATLLGTCALLLFTGCGHEPRSHIQRTDISARITNGSYPLAGALVNFSNPENGEAYGGTLDDQGNVQIKEMAVGNYTITVLPPPGDPVLEKPEKRVRDTMNIPKQFFTPRKSPLHASIGDGENHFEYDLQDNALAK